MQKIISSAGGTRIANNCGCVSSWQRRFGAKERQVALMKAEAMRKLRQGLCNIRIQVQESEAGQFIALDEACRTYGHPKAIRVDQGCQFTSKELDLWAYGKGVVLDFSRPGKPTDNACAESFNAIVRMKRLGQHWFPDLSDAQEKVENWRRHYNEVRPHGAIGDRSPQTMISRLEAPPRAANPPEVLI